MIIVSAFSNSPSQGIKYKIKLNVQSTETLDSLKSYFPDLKRIFELGYGEFEITEKQYQSAKHFLGSSDANVTIQYKVIDSLNINISYTRVGRVKDIDLYGGSLPINFELIEKNLAIFLMSYQRYPLQIQN